MFASRTDWPLAPNRLTQAVETRRRKGGEILDLTESNPTRCGFRYDSAEILAALSDARSLVYEPQPKGLLRARDAVAAYYAERGVRVDPDHIVLTASTSEAYSYVFRLLANSGDTLLAPRPSYPLFDFLAGISDVTLTPYELRYDDGWRIDTSSVESALRSAAASSSSVRAILVVHPNNPTGSLVSADESRFLVEFCRRHELALLVDEVFADYRFADSMGARSAEAAGSHAGIDDVLTFTLSGLSKVAALPQMKAAWIVLSGPKDLVRNALARLEIIADTYLSVSAPVAHALPRLLETRHAIQPQIRERLESNRAALDQDLTRISGVTQLESDGGWYAVLKLDRAGGESPRTDEDFVVELAAHEGVVVHPGHFYDFADEGFLVLSLLPQPEVFAEGVSRLVRRVAQERLKIGY